MNEAFLLGSINGMLALININNYEELECPIMKKWSIRAALLGLSVVVLEIFTLAKIV